LPAPKTNWCARQQNKTCGAIFRVHHAQGQRHPRLRHVQHQPDRRRLHAERKNLKRYQERITATGFAVERGIRLSRDDQIRRDAITRVMCDLELDFATFGQEWDVAFSDYFADALACLRPLADDGLVEIAADRISVTLRVACSCAISACASTAT